MKPARAGPGKMVYSCHGHHHRFCRADRGPEAAARRAWFQAGTEARAEHRERTARDRAPGHADALGEARRAAGCSRRPPDADADRQARARHARTRASVTPDSSVVVAAFASWNEHHEAALQALGDVRDIVAHVELEAYSVLTR